MEKYLKNKVIFFNGDIITMKQGNPEVEAVLIENGRIKKVGKKEELIKNEKNIQEIDLNGKTLMPGFIDSHSHITALAQTLGIISLKECESFDDIKRKVKNYIEKNNPKEAEWIIAHGYDHNFLKEKQHPNKNILDQITTKNPIMVVHASGHMGVTNSLGLKILNIDENTIPPQGGAIGKIKNTNEPDGYLEEKAFMEYSKDILEFSDEQKLDLLEQAQKEYIKNGITTAQDGITKEKEFNFLKLASLKEKLKIDIVSYVDIKESADLITENKEYVNNYKNRYKIGGYKMFLDGSPQAKTAWMSTPYEGEENYRGYGIYKDEEVKEFVSKSLREKMPLLTHSNGDQAAEQLLKAFENEQLYDKDDNNMLPISTRPVMIHAQTIRYDQIERLKKIQMIPSYFISHIYYWGDIHIKNLGKRAFKISPANYTKKQNIIFTLHQDTPVLEPNMLELVEIAVNRKTKDGIILGKEEKIDVYEALKAITIYGAYQYFEEKEKGTIEEGKLADLVILNENPLKIDKEKIKNIKVLATIKEGQVLFAL